MLPSSLLRQIADKGSEARKQAAIDIEQTIKGPSPLYFTGKLIKSELRIKGEKAFIIQLIQFLTTHFIRHTQPNSRKGGLLCLSATAVALEWVPSNIRFFLFFPPFFFLCFFRSFATVVFWFSVFYSLLFILNRKNKTFLTPSFFFSIFIFF